MITVGVWEREEGLYQALARVTAGLSPRYHLVKGRHPAELSAGRLDLLVASPWATGWAGAGAVDCRIALIPGSAGALARHLRAESAVSYGAAPKNTLTLSSLEKGHISIALQREVVTVTGQVVERQELLLPYPGGCPSPELFLAQAGALILLGLGPGE